jgi:single-strand DNA-binding protein
MANKNQCNFTGNLVNDPEMKYTQSGKALVKFKMAVNGFKKEDVSFINVECWDKAAEFVGEYVRKGNKVSITSRYKVDEYVPEGKTDKVYFSKFVAHEIENLTPKKEG